MIWSIDAFNKIGAEDNHSACSYYNWNPYLTLIVNYGEIIQNVLGG